MGEAVSSSERTELLALLTHFEGAFRTHLDFLHKYMAFYLTVMVAILAATVAAIVQTGRTPKIVALAPAAVLGLAILGWRVALIFYRRHVEAWMNVENILGMLDLRASRYQPDNDGTSRLRFQTNNSDDSFVVAWERPGAKRMLKRGQPANDVMSALSRRSDVMIAVQATFGLLGTTGAALFCFISFLE